MGTADRYIKLKQNKPLLIDWVYTLGMFVFSSVFMVNDKMCCGIHYNKKKQIDLLMARVGEIAAEKLMHKKACHPVDFTGRPMKGYVFIDPEGYDLEEDLLFWLDHCIAFNPKAKAAKKRKK